MNQYSHLFLHYGPGGNSEIERLWLNQYLDKINFFDVPDDCNQFSKITAQYESVLDEMTKTGPTSLIGHSFGADVALELAHRFPQKVSEIILVSPMRSLYDSFVELGKKVSLISPENTALLEAVKEMETNSSSDPEKRAGFFWKFVGEAFKSPDIFSIYWSDKDQFSKYGGFMQSSKPMNMESWQAGLNDYLINEPKVYDREIKAPVKVILGESDPYYSQKGELAFWSSKLGKENVHGIPACGHYPHLEKDALKLVL